MKKHLFQRIWLCLILFFISNTSWAQSLSSFTLVDAQTNQDIMKLVDGSEVDLAVHPSNFFNIRADVDNATASVRFDWNGQFNFRTESAAPYTLFGDDNGDYNGMSLNLGLNSLSGTPFSGAGASGNAGAALNISFTVINSSNTGPSGSCTGDGSHQVQISGELKQWHKITLDFEGPNGDESCSINPFLNYRMNILFQHANTGREYMVPGYFAGDGNAAETGATGGNIWRCHFAPDQIGIWNYTASFREGSEIAISLDPLAGNPVSFDGISGSFQVQPTDKQGRDFRAHGRLEYVGERYLRFAGSGKYFLKGGADAPENLLAYEDFDNTPNNGNLRKNWAPHLQDWNSGDPEWQGGKGRELIGALNYLAGKGMNVFSFLTLNINGDDKNVFPYVNYNGGVSPQEDRKRFDLSKLDQWEIIFEHADALGLYLHFKTQETENDGLLDQGQLGVERKLYYRELIARYSHHLALNWNLGEENNIWDELSDPSQSLIRSYTNYLNRLDPYGHNIVLHSYPGQQENVYGPLLGLDSTLTGTSLQIAWFLVHGETKKWIENSKNAGFPWVVANDEQGGPNIGVPPDPGYQGYTLPNNSPDQHDIRREVLWGNLMAGGAGVEYYFGYQLPQSDLNCQDWRSRDQMWEFTDYALTFFQQHIPFWEMESQDDLVSHGFCLAKSNEYYVVYIPNSLYIPTIDLPNIDFKVQWYNPRTGGSLQTVNNIQGSNNLTLPQTPVNDTQDWVILLSDASVSLPIELTYFTAKALNDGQVQLEWESSFEQNSSHYVIEARTGSSLIEVLGQVPASGNSDIPLTYSFQDYSNHRLYRLKMVDQDGSFSYSNWVEIGAWDGKIEVHPNPVIDQLTIGAPNLPEGSRVSITDILGRQLIDLDLGKDPKHVIDLTSLDRGYYLVRVYSELENLFSTRIYKN